MDLQAAQPQFKDGFCLPSTLAHQCQRRYMRIVSPSHQTSHLHYGWSYPIAQFIQRNIRAVPVGPVSPSSATSLEWPGRSRGAPQGPVNANSRGGGGTVLGSPQTEGIASRTVARREPTAVLGPRSP